MNLKRKILTKKMLVCLVLGVMLVTITGFVWEQKDIQVVVDGKIISVSTLKNDPKKILAQAGIEMAEKDEYRLSTEKVKDKTMITVYRAVPVSVTYKGVDQQITTGKPTVGEVLEELGIPDSGTSVTPNRNTKIAKDINIKVVNVAEKISERTVEEPFQIIRQPDSRMEVGQEEVAASGEAGSKVIKVKEHFEDGVKVSEETLEERIIKPAQPKIIKVGARDTIDTSRGAMRFRGIKYMNASAYLPTDGGGHGITATGMAARHGIVAVDPSVIPLGSRLYIPGYGLAIAADTGGDINGNRIDLCMEDYYDAISFGRREVKVYILD